MPVQKSIERISSRLAEAGAVQIRSYNTNGKPLGVIFQMRRQNIPMEFKLPVKAERVFDNMIKERKKQPAKNALVKVETQSERTAWKLLNDWIDIQTSIAQLDQMEPAEIFLPFVQENPQSFSSVDEFFTSNDFAEYITIGELEYLAIVDFETSQANGLNVVTLETHLTMKTNEAFSLVHGDLITVRSLEYTVLENRPDGTGLSLITLCRNER